MVTNDGVNQKDGCIFQIYDDLLSIFEIETAPAEPVVLNKEIVMLN